MEKVDVSIIIVNYFSSSLIKNCLSSIIEKSKNFTYEIIIVDNSNNEEEYQKLEKIVENRALIVKANENLGFGKGNNFGVQYAHGDYYYFLNGDTILLNNAIYELFNFLENNKNVAIVGSNLYTKGEMPNHSFKLHKLDLKQEKQNGSLIRYAKKKLSKKNNDFNYRSTPLNIDGYVCGASLMIRKDVFNKIGGFDKDIFLYSEEALLCFKAKYELNYKIYNVPSSKIIHLEGFLLDGNNLEKVKRRLLASIDGTYIYFLKAYGKNEAIKYLKLRIKIINKLIFVSTILLKKDLVKKYKIYKEGYENKLKSL